MTLSLSRFQAVGLVGRAFCGFHGEGLKDSCCRIVSWSVTDWASKPEEGPWKSVDIKRGHLQQPASLEHTLNEKYVFTLHGGFLKNERDD